MIVFHFIVSLMIFVMLCIPLAIAGVPIVAILLLTKWDGRSTIWGNKQWGRSKDHPSPGSRTNGYWDEFIWFVWRNPVNNLLTQHLARRMKTEYDVSGDEDIGDKKKGGFYEARMNGVWEYYWVWPYAFQNKWRCVRVRFGWKIVGNTDDKAEFVFVINPWKRYLGVIT